MKEFIVVSPQPWGNNRLSKHYVAMELSRRGRVLFVDPFLGRRPTALGNAQGTRPVEVAPNLFRCLPTKLPALRLPFMREANWRLFARQIRRAAATLGFERPTLILFDGRRPSCIGSLGEGFAVYYIVDPLEEPSIEEETERRADLVVVSSEPLYRQRKARGLARRLVFIPHGCPEELLADGIVADPELAVLPRPIIGLLGRVNENMDLELLERIVRECKRGCIALVGEILFDEDPGREDRLRGLAATCPALKLLGRVGGDRIGGVIEAFDVCLIPYDVARPRIAFASTLKVYQYLARGKPVVSTPAPDMLRFSGVVEVAADRESFARAVARLAAEGDPAGRERRIAFAREHTWAKTVDRLIEEIGKGTA